MPAVTNVNGQRRGQVVQKQAPTLGRLLVMVGFALSCFGLLLFLWLAFGGAIPLQPKGYRISAQFSQVGQLATEADVRISGVSVGKVKTIDLSPDGNSNVTIQLDGRYAPLPSNARAILRQKTLLGETYVELTPGSQTSPMLPDGGSLAKGNVAQSVALDQIFEAFDAPTRAAFRVWMEAQAQATDGRAQDINTAFGTLPAFSSDATDLLRLLNSQQGVVSRLVSNTGVVFGALSERGDQLSSLITNSNQVFATTAARDRQLAETFVALPTFEKESALTERRLEAFAVATDPLITQLRPAAKQLAPLSAGVAALAPELKWTAFFANSVAATQATDTPPKAPGPVHYLRTTNPVNLEGQAAYQQRLPVNRTSAYSDPKASTYAAGFKSYETRQCSAGRTVPTLGPAVPGIVSEEMRQLILDYSFGYAGNGLGVNAAPGCVQQAQFPLIPSLQGLTTYPQVRQASPTAP
ncbi:MAG: MlaD family protein [Solirubrobacterales bacterium]|nr:MlaD family protein [Solirubrobacterales bacterium]